MSRAISPLAVVEPVSRIHLVPFDEVRLSARPRDLVKGVIPRVGLVVAWGPPKSGKSFWMLDTAMHVALGWEYRGRRVQQGPVIYCAFEGQTGIEARLEAFRLHHLAEDRASVPFYLQPVTLDLVRDHAELIGVIKAQAITPALVVLDTLNRSFRGSESSDEDMTAYVTAADAIKAAFGCAVVLVHHCGIDGTRPRGHTSLTGAADAQIAISRDGADHVIAKLELAKDGPQGDEICSRLEVVEVGRDEDDEPITSCVVVPSDTQGGWRSPAAKGAGGVALDLLRKAIDEAGEPAPSGDRYPAGSRTIPLSVWRSYCDAGMVSDSDKPDSKRKAFVRACKSLQQRKLIGVWADQVWLTEPKRTART